MKIIKLFILLIFLLITKDDRAQTWRTATPYNGRINDIVFVDPMTGYACGQGAGIGNCTASGLVIKTIDGGTTWTRMNTVTTYELNKLFFKDAFTGWTLGAGNTVLKTTDGGVTWNSQTSGIGSQLNDIYFADYNTGFLCGNGGFLRKTVNGGTLFTTIASGVTSDLYAVHFVNASLGFIVGENGVVRKTTNGGTSFNSVYSGTDYFRDVCFINADTGFVMSPYVIFKTTNGGSSWTSFTAPPGSVMTRIHFVTARVGFVIGDSGFLLKTTDGGTTWNQLPVATSTLLRSIFFTDENTGYYGRDLGQIHKTSDGAHSWNSILSGLSDELFSVHFRNRELGLAIGKYGEIYRTQNGGLNWTCREVPGVSFLNRVRWLTDEKAIAVGANGGFVRSDDAGVHWYKVNTGVTDNLYDIQLLDSSGIFITYGDGRVMKTSDGGASWDTSLDTAGTFPLKGVFFLNNDTGYVCGSGNEVYRTYNGGNSWTLKNDSVSMSASFNDIFFTSRDTGYVAGTFGKLYRTINGGEWWHGMYPPGTSNADINEMQFLNNDTGFFSGSTSQRITINAGEHYSTMPTYCLANNWETHSIHIPVNGYGYCVGGMFGLLHTWQQDSMFSTYLQDSIFCAGSKIFVGYMASGLLGSTQILDVQLSDANGSFASPVIIGTFPLANIITDPSGIATCTLPPGANGTGYRIRVVCNSPLLISPDNGYDITINGNALTGVQLSLTTAKMCVGDTLVFNAQATGGGRSPAYRWTLDNHLLDWEAAGIGIDSLQGGIHILSVEMNSSLSCATSSAVDSVQFEIFQIPTVDAGSDQSMCAGESRVIGAPGNAGPLSWFPQYGLDNDTIAMPVASPDSSMAYILTTTNPEGCSATDVVQVNVNQLPAIDISGAAFICSGDSVLLVANTLIANPHISWTPSTGLSSDTGSQVYAMPLSDATFYATIMDDSSCVNTDSISIAWFPAAVVPTLAIVSGSLVVTDNTQNLIWYRDGMLIPGFTNDTLLNPADGSYRVKASDSNGCEAWSQPIYFSTVGLQQANTPAVHAYFNEGMLKLKMDGGSSVPAAIHLFDLSGRTVFETTIQLNGSGVGEIEIKNISNGIYFSRIQILGVDRVLKIVVE